MLTRTPMLCTCERMHSQHTDTYSTLELKTRGRNNPLTAPARPDCNSVALGQECLAHGLLPGPELLRLNGCQTSLGRHDGVAQEVQAELPVSSLRALVKLSQGVIAGRREPFEGGQLCRVPCVVDRLAVLPCLLFKGLCIYNYAGAWRVYKVCYAKLHC